MALDYISVLAYNQVRTSLLSAKATKLQHIMVLRRLAARLQQPYNLSTAPLLDFLAPGLCSGSWVKPFSSTSNRRSRIGSAPLSLPTEVNLRVIEPPPVKQSVIRKAEPRRTIEVEGPRGMQLGVPNPVIPLMRTGKISFEIPPFISIDHDQSTRKVALAIANRNERKQREMWGMCGICPSKAAIDPY